MATATIQPAAHQYAGKPVSFDKQSVQPTPPASPPRSSLSLLISSKESNANTTAGVEQKPDSKRKMDNGQGQLTSCCLTFACPKPDRVERKFQRPTCGTPPPKRYLPAEEDDDEEGFDEDDEDEDDEKEEEQEEDDYDLYDDDDFII